MKYIVTFKCYHYNTGGSPPNNHYYDEIKEFDTLQDAIDLKELIYKEMAVGDGSYYDIEDGFVFSTAEIQVKNEFVSITVIKDNNGEIYFLPSNLVDEFKNLCKLLEKEGTDEWYDNCDKFNDTFRKYQLEGDLSDYQLFISQEELKNLTNE